MTFTPKTWHDGPTGGTSISAEELNRIEAGIAEAIAAASEGGGGGSVPADVPATGDRWGLPGVPLSGIGQLSVTPGGIYYAAFTVSAPIVVTGARLNVGVEPGSAANVRIGIYGADGVGPDDHAPLWDSGAIAVAADFTGAKYVADMSIELAAGRYLAAVAADNYLGLGGGQRAGASFLGDDNQLKALWFNVFTFGAFPTPGPAALAATTDLVVPFLLQWTAA